MSENNPLVLIEKAIESAESRCDGEIIVAFAEMSGPYKDRRLILSLIAMIATVSCIIFSSVVFSRMSLLVNGAVSFVLVYGLSYVFPTMLGLVTSPDRRFRQVRSCAELVWYREGVSLTKRRTGIFMYLSLLEKESVLLCDTGIKQKVPQCVIGKLESDLKKVALSNKPVESFVGFLHNLAAVLEEYVPEEEDNPDELPNTPIWLKGSDLWP